RGAAAPVGTPLRGVRARGNAANFHRYLCDTIVKRFSKVVAAKGSGQPPACDQRSVVGGARATPTKCRRRHLPPRNAATQVEPDVPSGCAAIKRRFSRGGHRAPTLRALGLRLHG